MRVTYTPRGRNSETGEILGFSGSGHIGVTLRFGAAGPRLGSVSDDGSRMARCRETLNVAQRHRFHRTGGHPAWLSPDRGYARRNWLRGAGFARETPEKRKFAGCNPRSAKGLRHVPILSRHAAWYTGVSAKR